MNADEQALFERVLGAWRPRRPGEGPRAHPAWHDLDEALREQAFEETGRLRSMEAAVDPQGLSGTGRAVLARILGR